ncbi:unnamed protein product, partial [Bubo scandiacus]
LWLTLGVSPHCGLQQGLLRFSQSSFQTLINDTLGLRKGYSSLISRALELALGYREPKQNRRYVFILHVISRPVYAFLLDNPTPAALHFLCRSWCGFMPADLDPFVLKCQIKTVGQKILT